MVVVLTGTTTYLLRAWRRRGVAVFALSFGLGDAFCFAQRSFWAAAMRALPSGEMTRCCALREAWGRPIRSYEGCATPYLRLYQRPGHGLLLNG